ncbi:MAG: GGDEF domain-containing protein [Campylobacterota bacterium]|nr:GGDEF domain-containing protein [Campylobacterota bacterium]
MNLSIKKIFTSVTTLLTIFILLLVLIALMMLGEHNSKTQISILQKHRSDIQSIKNIQTQDETLDMIKFQSISAELSNNVKNYAETFTAFDPLRFLSSSSTDHKNFETFTQLNTRFITDTKKYIANKESQQAFALFNKQYNALNLSIYEILTKHIDTEHEQFIIRETIIYASVIVGLLFLLMIHRQFHHILRDIESLYGVTSKNSPYQIKTIEIQAVVAKYKKDSHTDNPMHIDPLTQLKNYKGLIHTYNSTPAIREHNTLSVCIFNIDNYAALKNTYHDEYMEVVRKKIAFLISLYAQAIDITASIEESKFAIILGRNTKKEALEECEKIRQSIAETHFKVPQGDKVSITVSGGFTTKSDKKPIEDTIQLTKDILSKAQEKSINLIAQLRTNSKKF